MTEEKLQKRPRSVSECIAMEVVKENDKEKCFNQMNDIKQPITKGEQLITEALIVPPDGGYGWVILIASFLNNVIIDGISVGAGQALIPIWTKHFSVTSSSVSLIFSLQSCFYLFSGPVSGVFVKLYGCRLVSLGGATMSAAGLLLSTIAPSVECLYVTYGVIAGVGFGALFLCGIIMISEYFEKKRSLATGLSVCGSGVGCCVFPPLLNVLVENYSWSQTLLLIAGVELHCLVFSALYRRVSPKKDQLEQVQKTLATILQSESVQIVYDGEGKTSPRLAGEMLKNCQKKSTATAADNRSDSIFTDTMSNVGDADDSAKPRFVRGKLAMNSVRSSFAKRMPFRQQSLVLDIDKAVEGNQLILKQLSYTSIRSFNQPMHRLDALYPGSVHTLSEVSSAKVEESKNDQEEVLPAIRQTTNATFASKLKTALLDMINVHLLRKASFLLFSLTCILSSVGLNVPYLYLPSQSELQGNTKQFSSMLISIIGIANIASRLISGWIGDRPKVDCIVITNCANFLSGIATMMVPHLHTYGLLVTYCCLFGTGVGALMSMRSLVTVQLVGLNNLTSAFGMLMLFMGFSVFIGPPMAALLYEATSSHQLSFYISGGLMTAAGALGLGLKTVFLWEQKKTKEDKLIASKLVDGVKKWMCKIFKKTN